MAIEFKDKNQLVEATIEALRDRLPENTNYSDGSVIRTIIEIFMEELDKQYWTLEQVYDNAFIDTAYGEDLDKLVAILGLERDPAKKAKGEVVFYRSTPADRDYLIPSGTLVETYINADGISVQFQTTEDVILLQDTTEITAPIECMVAGEIGNVAIGNIVLINNPPAGIEGVRNDAPTFDGEEEEDDETLKNRAKLILDTKGLATLISLYNKIKNLDGIRQVSVLDMARGIGTVDIFVLADVVPMQPAKKTEIETVISETKAAGIDVLLREPNLIPVDITATLTMKEGFTVESVLDGVEEAINNYVNNLAIGEALIKNQLERSILNSSDKIIDIDMISPATNITITDQDVIRVGIINIQ